MPNSSSGGDEVLPIGCEVVAVLDADAVHVVHDESFLYAACRDLKVRVWSKKDWQLVAELGETASEPLAVHVDEEQVFATCERRVYVWKKENWGMVGWFELTYPAISSTLHGDCFYVGAKEGRLVSIKKDTHETSSWQLHKSDLTTLWSDDRIIVTATKKEEPRIWNHSPNSAPSEIAKFEKKVRATAIVGNTDYVYLTNGNGEISVFDKDEWTQVGRFERSTSGPVVDLWANDAFLVSVTEAGSLDIWNLIDATLQGQIEVDQNKIESLDVDGYSVYLASGEGVVVVGLSFGEAPFDLSAEEQSKVELGYTRSSPYDVLELILQLQATGDEHFKAGSHQESVAAYEKAMQGLVDSSQELRELPEERQKLTEDLNLRLGRALLKTKIQEVDEITTRIRDLTESLAPEGKFKSDDNMIDKLWDDAEKLIRESRILSDTQAGNILSYQLSDAVDTLESEVKDAMSQVHKQREKINKAIALTHGIMSQWRWLERRNTSLEERKVFLEDAMQKIKTHLEGVDSGSQVERILLKALSEHESLYAKIVRIIEAAKTSKDDDLLSREEAELAVRGLLRVLPKRLEALESISNPEEKLQELEQLISALNQALESSKRFKIKESLKEIEDAIELLSSIQVVPEEGA
ncbi:MAG: hypothetical protein EAX95_12600 [Candidatus Thorarchaeota archaeon]|nr:hypothetical protein [Candidatus Thorarchaeota archaeon]